MGKATYSHEASDPATPAASTSRWYPKADGFYMQDPAGNVTRIGQRHNFAATVAPAVTDDSGDGYGIGSIWINVTGNTAYICESASVGAANWLQIDGAGGGANTALSNLAAVAVNTHIIPNATNTHDSGSASAQWANIYGIITHLQRLHMTQSATSITLSAGGDADFSVVTTAQNYISIVSNSGTTDTMLSTSNLPNNHFFFLRADTAHTITVQHDGTTIKTPGGVDITLTGTMAPILCFVTGAVLNFLGHTNFATSSHVHDASVITYAPSVLADWDAAADPGNTDDGLDQLAERITDIEVAGTTDAAAIHDNLASEITAITEKTAPTINDELVIEDLAAAEVKKSIKIAALPAVFQVGGRLTLTTGLPVLTSDVSGATTIYFTPQRGATVTLWDTTYSKLVPYTFSELSLSVPATSTQMYDVFLYNSGTLASPTLTLEAVAWTNDTTRATGLVLTPGMYAKSGALGRLYLGSFRTVASNTASTVLARMLWNYYNRVPLSMYRNEATATNSWTYNGTWRAANNSTSNRVEFVVGVIEDPVSVKVGAQVQANAAAETAAVGIGVDTTTSNTAIVYIKHERGGTQKGETFAWLDSLVVAGYHYLQWVESCDGAGAATFSGDTTAVTGYATNSGLTGITWG